MLLRTSYSAAPQNPVAELFSVGHGLSRLGIREKIFSIQEMLANLPQCLDQCVLTHTFAPGTYARQMFIPKGTLIIGKIHKHAHINIISFGEVLVLTEEQGTNHLVGPLTFTSTPLTKRLVYAIEDTLWTTIHLTNTTDLAEIEAEIILPNYDGTVSEEFVGKVADELGGMA